LTGGPLDCGVFPLSKALYFDILQSYNDVDTKGTSASAKVS